MKTRTLLLLALGCAIAILAAGVVMAWQVSRDSTVDTAPLDVPTRVGDMSVSVGAGTVHPSAQEVGGADSANPSALSVPIELSGAFDDAPTENFRLFVAGDEHAVDHSDCPAVGGSGVGAVAVDDGTVSCTLWFSLQPDEVGAKLLSYRRGEARSVWLVAD